MPPEVVLVIRLGHAERPEWRELGDDGPRESLRPGQPGEVRVARPPLANPDTTSMTPFTGSNTASTPQKPPPANTAVSAATGAAGR